MTSNDELLYYMLGQVNQERDWDLPQDLGAVRERVSESTAAIRPSANTKPVTLHLHTRR